MPPDEPIKTASDLNDLNSRVVEEFRANAGVVGGRFHGMSLLLLHSVGARSGAPRVNPLGYRAHRDGWVVIGSKGGTPGHPDWYYNLIANPDAAIEVGVGDGTENIEVRARLCEGDERGRLWAAQIETAPVFIEYERTAKRLLPVVMLDRRDARRS
jgi:deazaflavin-dependent oxidoreductase (nitroreductase family)